MIKNFSKLLLCMAVACFASCSSVDDEPAVGTDQAEEATVRVNISRAEAADFADAGISEFTVYVYNVERKSTSLYSKQVVPASDGSFELSFPLGNTYQTVAVANAASVTGDETLETLTLNLDPVAKNDVWCTNVVRFASDKSVSEISLNFSRKVAAINFAPAETEAELASAGFDNLNLTFTQVATSYLVQSGKGIATEVKVSAPKSAGYKASFYTFDTYALENGTLNIEFTNGGQTVKQSKPLECTKYLAGKKINCIVPVTDPTIVDSSRSEGAGILFEVSDF